MAKARFAALHGERRELAVVAIDLGYSARADSCGLATCDEARALTFGACVCQTAGLIREIGSDGVVLVLEAVLSTCHDEKTGNPCIRGEFERGRGWYYGAGVVTFAAALRFLDRLNANPTLPTAVPVHLAEALLSFKSSKQRSDHVADARRIVEEFWKVLPEQLVPGVEPASPHVMGVPPIRVFRQWR
jgi:hypothetical protein